MVGVAWYMLITTVRDTSKSYQTALNSARKFAKLKINKDAEEKYFEAYNISPSYELSVEIAKFYKTQVKTRISFAIQNRNLKNIQTVQNYMMF